MSVSRAPRRRASDDSVLTSPRGGGGGGGRTVEMTPSAEQRERIPPNDFDTPTNVHALATTPYNSPIFHPRLYPSDPNVSQVEFATLFPAANATATDAAAATTGITQINQDTNNNIGVGVGLGLSHHPPPTLPLSTPFHSSTRSLIGGGVGVLPHSSPFTGVTSGVGVTMTPMTMQPTLQAHLLPHAAPFGLPTSLTTSQLHQLQQLQQLQTLQAQLLAHQQSMARPQPPPQPVYATPAAWHKQRQFLLNQPTPTAVDVAPSPHAPPPTTATFQRMRRSIAGSPIMRGAEFLPNSLSIPTDEPPPPPPPPHRRSFSSFNLTSATATAAPSESQPASPRMRNGTFRRPPGTAAAAAASSKLAHIQASMRHLKKLQLLHEEEKATAIQKTRIQKTFLSLSSFLIVVFVAILCYYDYLILSPHLHALFWAFLFWILLDTPQRWLLQFFAMIDARLLDRHARKIELLGCFITVILGFIFRFQLSSLIILGFMFITFTFFLFGDRHTVTAILLLVIILLLFAFPLFLFTKTCVLESQEIGSRLRSFIESNREFQHILEDFSTSSTFLAMQKYVKTWGYEIPTASVEQLREWILKSIVQFADHITTILTSVYGLLSNVGNMLVSLVTFASMLYFLLVSNRDFHGTLTWLSPFSADDNSKLIETLKQSVRSIFVCSFCVGFIHVVVTYISFSLCGIDLCLILSFISGFAAMLPIFSSWVIWLPACGGLLLAGQTFEASILGIIQTTLLFYIDPLIYSNIPGNSYVIGLSIVFAAYTFGAAGVLLGPLLAGMTFTFLSIYRDYISLPLYTSHIDHHVTPNVVSSPTMSEFGLGGTLDSNVGTNSSTTTTAGTGTMEPPTYGYPRASPSALPSLRSHARGVGSVSEIGSLSTSHSSNTLSQLASGLQTLAEQRHRNGSTMSNASSNTTTPISRAISAHTSPSPTHAGATARTLRFATTPEGGGGSLINTSLDRSIGTPNHNAAGTAAGDAIVEGDESDHAEEELSPSIDLTQLHSPISPSSLTPLDTAASRQLLSRYRFDLSPNGDVQLVRDDDGDVGEDDILDDSSERDMLMAQIAQLSPHPTHAAAAEHPAEEDGGAHPPHIDDGYQHQHQQQRDEATDDATSETESDEDTSLRQRTINQTSNLRHQ